LVLSNIIIKNEKEIEILREGGKRLAFVLNATSKMVKPGVSTKELDDYAEKLIREGGDEPAFLDYQPPGAHAPYPASLCTSINDEIVHCVPEENRILKEGDIISIDLGLKHKGMFTDHAMTVPVGNIDAESKKLIADTKRAMEIGIAAALGGNYVGDIGEAIEKFVKENKQQKYGIVKELAGHGVGKEIHEAPFIPNFRSGRARGEKLVPGMVIAIEPMLNLGTEKVIFEDEYTVRTKDGKRSAHFEHTILITEGKPEILTSL
jgi:methionyl aminopeptidase